jgi:hypothetical protein
MHRIASFELIMNASWHGTFATLSGSTGRAREQIPALRFASPDAPRSPSAPGCKNRISGGQTQRQFGVDHAPVKHKM